MVIQKRSSVRKSIRKRSNHKDFRKSIRKSKTTRKSRKRNNNKKGGGDDDDDDDEDRSSIYEMARSSLSPRSPNPENHMVPELDRESQIEHIQSLFYTKFITPIPNKMEHLFV